MYLAAACPKCATTIHTSNVETAEEIVCGNCQWTKPVQQSDINEGAPTACLLCGCADLWRQKDFPPKVGLTIVGLGMLLSTIAFYNYKPVWALGILAVFGLSDLLIYTLMGDVLVCYRCNSRHRTDAIPDERVAFDLEVAERYRQETKRLEQASQGRT